MKINLRESLNKIDLATNNKYDLLNTFDSKKLSNENKKKLAEAIENNSMASVNRILHESEEQLYKVIISSGATKRNFESALYEDEAKEIVDYYGGRWIDENGFEWNMYVEEDDDSTEHAMVDNSYDMEDDYERAQREMDAYDQSDKDWEYVESLKDKDVLEYDDDISDELIDMFDIASPQDVADSFKKDVKSKNKIYKPTNNESLKESYENFFEIETNLRSNSKIKMSSGSWKVDTIYLMYDSAIDDAPHLIGYAHDDNGNYDRDALTADEIVNCDLSDYMDGIDVVDVERMIEDNPKYFYTKFNYGSIKFDESAKRSSKSLEEASYGGAYDIEDDMFFTKEEIVEFVEEICEYLGDIFGYQYDINNVYMDGPRKLYINIYDNNYIEVESTFDIDMRKIRKPSDLSKVYGLTIENWFQKAFAREYRDAGLDESLTEDTVKQNGKWVNKGDAGETHGKFKTKKAADAQRKAMFSNGYKAESLNRQEYSSGNYFLTVDKTGMGPHYSLYYQHPHSGYDGLMFIVDGYGYDNFKEKLSKFSTVYPNEDVQNLLKNINENKSNDKSLEEKLVPAPQEVVNELLAILEKYDFVFDDSLKHPIGKTWSGNTHIQVINKNSSIEETDDPDIYSEQLMRYIPDSMENEIDKLSDRSGCRITYSFGANRNWQVTGGLDIWEKYVPGLQDESLKEQVSFPGYAVKYTSGYAGNGVNNSETEWFRTKEERDRRAKELKDKNYTEIKTWKMDNFYHTPPKNESLNEAYEYLYNQPFLKTFDEFVSKVSGLKADELDDEVWNEYFHEYQVYNERYKTKDFENKLRKSLEEKDLEVISIEPNETATLVTVKFDGKEKKFRFKFRLFDINDDTEEYYIHYIVSMIAGYFGLNESLKEDYDKLSGYSMLSSTLKDGGDTYALLRKTEDGKTKWAAAKYVNGIPDEDNIFEITYEQARGFEPLTDIGKVSRKLGKALLPKKESLKEAIDDEIDLDYETDFDDDGVEEGNVFVEGGVEYAWIQREAGPLYLDFDKWAVWSAREYVDPRDFMTAKSDGEGYDFDGDAFKEKAMAAPITYFVVDEDTGFIDWGPEDNEIAAKDFLNGKKEDWENDMDESLNEDKELREYYSVNLHYEDIGDGREYDYEADYDDVLEYLMEYCVDDDNAPENTQEYMEWVVINFDYLFKKYEYDLLKHFYEDASQEEYDKRHSSYEPEYDPMD